MGSLLVLLPAVALSCGQSDSRCGSRPEPGANYGPCAEVIGAYYDPLRNGCISASGCGCNGACRDTLPFETVEACEQLCR